MGYVMTLDELFSIVVASIGAGFLITSIAWLIAAGAGGILKIIKIT